MPAPLEDQDKYSSDFLLKLMEETEVETEKPGGSGNRVDDIIILDQEERKLVKPTQFDEESKLYPQILKEKLSALKSAAANSRYARRLGGIDIFQQQRSARFCRAAFWRL